MDKKDKNTKPKVVAGLESRPASINEQAIRRLSAKRQIPLEEMAEKVLLGDRVMLSRALTLVESTRQDHRQQAEKLLEKCLSQAGNSIRIGITGTPGVGKSTYIEAFGKLLTKQGHKVAVLAVDPSSQLTRGSILGDKTRMEDLSVDKNAFIRPSPAGSSLGGVARKTRESILLCEAAGYNVILVETVGVGQSETAVHSMVDFFLLLLLPGAGDELQGIKRGIVEMADLIAINKADGDNLRRAKLAKGEYSRALHHYPPKESAWTPLVKICSALQNTGIGEIWEAITQYQTQVKTSGYWETHRQAQAQYWLHESIRAALGERFYSHPKIQEQLAKVEADIAAGRMTSFHGARVLLALF